jgi:hypothetical protein
VFETVKRTAVSNVIKITFFFLIFHVSFSLDQEDINSTASSSSSSSSSPITVTQISNGNVRHPIKRRTMAQVPLPTEESSSLNVSLDISSDGDITIVEKRKIYELFVES